jgi:predicted transcriptional regulator
VAKIFLERRISAAPVVDDQGKLVGIISEGELEITEVGIIFDPNQVREWAQD